MRGGLSQVAFAEKLGVHKNTVGRWERGAGEPDVGAASTICRVFKVSPRWLLDGTGPMHSDYSPSSSKTPQLETDYLQETISALKDENKDLRQESKELREENRDLRNENKELRDECRQLRRYEAEYLRLKPDRQENGDTEELGNTA